MEKYLHSIDGIELEYVVRDTSMPLRASALLVHGITADKDEGGMYADLADGLEELGVQSLRFSFRGHGKSGGTQKGMTIAGECLDLWSAYERINQMWQGQPLIVIASSFGAVSTGLMLPFMTNGQLPPLGLALWNPVLDVSGTFVDPVMPWGRENFNDTTLTELQKNGFMKLDGTFEVGWVLANEMVSADPRPNLSSFDGPILICHGDRDQSVSYEESQLFVSNAPNRKLITIEGSDHGFSGADYEAQAISATCTWVSQLLSGAR